MTESAWLTASSPQEMLQFLHDKGMLSDRKARLFACATVRRVWHLLADERSRGAVGLAERYADGEVGPEELNAAGEALHSTDGHGEQGWESARAARAAWHVVRPGGVFDLWDDVRVTATFLASWLIAAAHQPDLLRDIVANPFAAPPRIDPAWLAWNDGTIAKLAEAAYQERALPSGELDRERLAVLADALEEVGADAVLLEHLRGPGPRVRGDWVVDLLTGRE